MGFTDSDSNMTKMRMLESERRMTQALDILRRFDSLTWDEVVDLVTVGIFNEATQHGLFNFIDRCKALKIARPSMAKNLERSIRKGISQSFHVVDRFGGVSSLGAMVFEPDSGTPPWSVFNSSILVANFQEGNFGRVTGNPGTGKTNLGCEIIREAKSKGLAVFSNIGKAEPTPVYEFVRDARELFTAVSALPDGVTWILVLDEGGLVYSRQDATTRRAKDLDKLMRVIRHLHGSVVIIEQRPDSIPRILMEFSTSIFHCDGKGLVSIDLRGPKLAFRGRVCKFPKTKVPFNTYDIGYFAVNVDIVAMLEKMSGSTEPMKVLGEFIASEKQKPTRLCMICNAALPYGTSNKRKICFNPACVETRRKQINAESAQKLSNERKKATMDFNRSMTQ
jgi:hypothetical protein